MGKQDYREAIEKGRQEIYVHSNSAPSRRAHRKTFKEKPQKNKSILLPTLFFLFILIPVSLLIYVAFFYEPNDTLTASSVNNEVSLESLSPEPPLVPAALDEEESSTEQQADEEEVEKAAELQAETEKEDELKEKAAAKEKEKEAEAQAQREREQAEAKRQQEQAEAKRQQEQAEAKRQQEAAEQKKQQEKQSAAKTHTVQAGETLYRIAVNAYGASGASAGVEKIKQANGLSSNEISVGATLVLP